MLGPHARIRLPLRLQPEGGQRFVGVVAAADEGAGGRC
jgi:hypothetical protein